VQLRLDRFPEGDVPALLQRVAAMAARRCPGGPDKVVLHELAPNFLGHYHREEAGQWLEAFATAAQTRAGSGAPDQL